MTVGRRIAEARKNLGMSADALARQVGCNRATIFRWENGDTGKIPIFALEKMARALQVTPGYLMGWQPQQAQRQAMARREIFNRICAYKGISAQYDDDAAERVMSDVLAYFDFTLERRG